MAGIIESRLRELGIALPEAAAPAANYVPYVVVGNLVFISGQLPIADGKIAVTGRLGAELSLEEGRQAARLCGLNLIAQARAACGGDLERVKRVVRLAAFVSSTPEFTDHPKVVNGASDLMVEVFGDKGRHSRAAVGVAALPLNAAVEIDGIFEIG
jgi:enamine deaminase RidA (YjgF/YER057c/UK114 family)